MLIGRTTRCVDSQPSEVHHFSLETWGLKSLSKYRKTYIYRMARNKTFLPSKTYYLYLEPPALNSPLNFSKFISPQRRKVTLLTLVKDGRSTVNPQKYIIIGRKLESWGLNSPPNFWKCCISRTTHINTLFLLSLYWSFKSK